MRTVIKWVLIGTSLAALAWSFPVRTAGQAAARGDVRQGRRADPLRQLRLLPSARRGRALLAAVLQGRAALGAVDQAAGGPRGDAAVERRPALRRIPRPAPPHRRGDRHDRRVGGRRREGRQPGGHCRPRRSSPKAGRSATPDLVLTMAGAGEDPGDRHGAVHHLSHRLRVRPRTPGCRRSKSARATAASCTTRWRRPTLPGVANGAGRPQNVHLYSPGLEAMVWREGYGKFFPKGTRFSFQMHYNAIGTRDDATRRRSGSSSRRDAGAHTGQHDHRAEQHAGRAADGAEARGDRARSSSRATRASTALRPHMHLRAQLGTASLIQPGRRAHACCCTFRTGTTRGRTTTCWRGRRGGEGLDPRVPRQLRQLAGQSAQSGSDGSRCRGGSRCGTRCTRST